MWRVCCVHRVPCVPRACVCVRCVWNNRIVQWLFWCFAEQYATRLHALHWSVPAVIPQTTHDSGAPAPAFPATTLACNSSLWPSTEAMSLAHAILPPIPEQNAPPSPPPSPRCREEDALLPPCPLPPPLFRRAFITSSKASGCPQLRKPSATLMPYGYNPQKQKK